MSSFLPAVKSPSTMVWSKNKTVIHSQISADFISKVLRVSPPSTPRMHVHIHTHTHHTRAEISFFFLLPSPSKLVLRENFHRTESKAMIVLLSSANQMSPHCAILTEEYRDRSERSSRSGDQSMKMNSEGGLEEVSVLKFERQCTSRFELSQSDTSLTPRKPRAAEPAFIIQRF